MNEVIEVKKMEQNKDQGSEFDNLFENDSIVNKSRLEQKENKFWWV
jgi:hypothetical protein